MSRAAWFSLLAALLVTTPSCAFAVKHPAIAAGAVAGTVALGTCELAASDHGRCFLTSGAVGVGLAVIASVALWLGSEDEVAPTTSEPAPKIDWEKVPDTTPAEPTKAPPPLDPAPTPPPPPPTPGPPPTPASPAPPTPTPPPPAPTTPTTPPPAS